MNHLKYDVVATIDRIPA